MKIIACATVIEEMEPLFSSDVDFEVLDFGLHLTPENLKRSLQQSIDRAGKTHDVVLLGYGLCSMAVVGLYANCCTLVIPKVDDCIAIFLGSHAAYRQQIAKEPGTYYLTKGWIEVSDTLLDEYQVIVEKYGQDRADRIMDQMLKNYKRLVYIDTGTDHQEKYQSYACSVAEKFDLDFEVVPGKQSLIKKMLFGPWDDEFVVIEPGQVVKYIDFKEVSNE